MIPVQFAVHALARARRSNCSFCDAVIWCDAADLTFPQRAVGQQQQFGCSERMGEILWQGN
jgi:hypothetical protein